MQIPVKYTPVVDIALDTISLKKQALVFVNSKASAEKQAEDVAKNLEVINPDLEEQVLKVLPTPTKQCKRLAFCIARGSAFHHAGLHQKQREIIEDNFRAGNVKIICSTPTLAAGLDMPAFRAVLKDMKRFTHRGMDFIPVLEYLQMAGRAGRPKYDTVGESIILTSTESQKNEIHDRYILGKPEEIYSKLAAEPVMRTYVLSLLATGHVKTRDDLLTFFSKTFFGHQYDDMDRLSQIVDSVLHKLSEWEFLKSTKEEFASADDLGEKYTVTLLGKRVAELYLDPYTAHQLVERIKKHEDKTDFAYLQALSHTLEMRPLLRVKAKEEAIYQEKAAIVQEEVLEEEPFDYDDYVDYLASIKTASFFEAWCTEKNDDEIFTEFDIRPGEIRAKLDRVDWLIFSLQEMSKILLTGDRNDLAKLRMRLSYGVKEELLPLVKIKNVGRARARKLYRNGIKHAADLRRSDPTTLKQLIGEKTAQKILQQLSYN